jgi:hypothetical protein
MSSENYAPPKAELELAPKHGESGRTRLHSLSAIGIAAFLGGPFAAGYLVHRNFIRLGHRKNASQALGWFGAGGVLALYVAWHTPADVISFMLSVGFPQLITVLVATRIVQGQAITAHRLAGGQMHSNWFAVAPSVAVSLVTKALFYGLSYWLKPATGGA